MDLLNTFRDAMCHTLDDSRDRTLHCLHQLTAQQAWSRPRPEMNSVANAILHVSGNLRQWIVAGVGGTPDTRDRPAEFAARDGYTIDQLDAHLHAAVAQSQTVIRQAPEAELLRVRFVQVRDVTGIGAITHSVSHLEGHTQETVYATRLILGQAYRFRSQY